MIKKTEDRDNVTDREISAIPENYVREKANTLSWSVIAWFFFCIINPFLVCFFQSLID